ncbi:hypothetical protein BDZ90DRAFT_4900 [Jaminaea rosea]|uniref:Uncharacterized protein n=1 Tax=Jaminaea rosea TaxID=1569628 RepID=A0A316UYN5_9BASI|nr:hypothetical protein BDZ90DRAFT_4900 [Jaminaea rosea]PWN30104.1 hypothetical protein BDZ90DRAFT_4900 [Jaminaea rosea]
MGKALLIPGLSSSRPDATKLHSSALSRAHCRSHWDSLTIPREVEPDQQCSNKVAEFQRSPHFGPVLAPASSAVAGDRRRPFNCTVTQPVFGAVESFKHAEGFSKVRLSTTHQAGCSDDTHIAPQNQVAIWVVRINSFVQVLDTAHHMGGGVLPVSIFVPGRQQAGPVARRATHIGSGRVGVEEALDKVSKNGQPWRIGVSDASTTSSLPCLGAHSQVPVFRTTPIEPRVGAPELPGDLTRLASSRRAISPRLVVNYPD